MLKFFNCGNVCINVVIMSDGKLFIRFHRQNFFTLQFIFKELPILIKQYRTAYFYIVTSYLMKLTFQDILVRRSNSYSI